MLRQIINYIKSKFSTPIQQEVINDTKLKVEFIPEPYIAYTCPKLYISDAELQIGNKIINTYRMIDGIILDKRDYDLLLRTYEIRVRDGLTGPIFISQPIGLRELLFYITHKNNKHNIPIILQEEQPK